MTLFTQLIGEAYVFDKITIKKTISPTYTKDSDAPCFARALNGADIKTTNIDPDRVISLTQTPRILRHRQKDQTDDRYDPPRAHGLV